MSLESEFENQLFAVRRVVLASRVDASFHPDTYQPLHISTRHRRVLVSTPVKDMLNNLSNSLDVEKYIIE